MNEIELYNELQKLEQQEDDDRRQWERFQKEEEERDAENQKELYEVEQMREACTENDRDIISLLDEKQELLLGMRKKRAEFEAEIKINYYKRKQEIESKKRAVEDNLRELKTRKEEGYGQ